uniref:dnaJ homolog subfamily C member 24-like n=1 Tax=Ciona intestinalis TaxID=7719 RepID=UPI0002B8D154|nr:dnaJ homolog subfamily C member 24-like [Ciona intestinalis]|eukprot:XP_026692797.1 dnaJ homolog subfamily C member 24-like [Ciona intestinalis]
MQNCYEVLECPNFSPHAVVKMNYQRLLLQHHPDKQLTPQPCDEGFIKINHAWKILNDDKAKKNHDSALNQQLREYDVTINEIVNISEFDYDETIDNDDVIMFDYVCRCGGSYELFSNISSVKNILPTIVGCSICSLYIEVVS